MADHSEQLTLGVVVRGADKAAADLGKVQRAEDAVGVSAKTSTRTATTAWDEYQTKMNAATVKMTGSLTKAMEVYQQFGPAAAAGQTEALAAIERGNAALIASFTRGGEQMVEALRLSISGPGGLAATATAEMTKANVAVTEQASLLSRSASRAGSIGTAVGSGGGLKGTLGAVGATAGVMAGYDFLSGSITKASDATEAKNLLDRLSPGLSERIEGMDTARKFGMSKGETMQNVSGLLAQFSQAGMSKADAANAALTAVQGAADIGSFKNIDPADVLEKLQSGMAGETRSLRDIGIFTSLTQINDLARKQNGLKAGAMPTPDETLAAAWQTIQASGGWKQAAGDYDISFAGSFANQQRTGMAQVSDEQEKLGQALLPFAEKGLEFFVWALNVIGPPLEAFLNTTVGIVNGLNPFSTTNQAKPWQQSAPSDDDGSQPFWLPGGFQHMRNNVLSFFGIGGGKASGGMVPGWSPGIDNMMVPLSGGEGVLTPETVAMLGGANTINALNLQGLRGRGGYANGTGSAQATASMVGGGGIGGPLGIIAGIYATGSTGGGSAAAPAYSAGAGVGQWGSLVRQAMTMRGLDPNGPDFNRIMNQMGLESSGNPNAINLTDSNARKGTPSIGLLQVIQPTFDEYAYPGHSSNIRDPLSNILASIGYMLGRYGSVEKAIGPGGVGPYDSGGWLHPGVNAVSGLDKPEPVLTPEQWDTARAAIEKSVGGGGVTVTIGTIEVNAGGGDAADLSSSIRDGLADAIAARVNRTNDRRS